MEPQDRHETTHLAQMPPTRTDGHAGPTVDPMAQTEPAMVQVLDQYQAAGFGGDAFVTEDGMIRCGTCGRASAPEAVQVHSIRRMEGASDPADESGVLALVCPQCGARATAVLQFGPEASPAEVEVWLRLVDRRSSDLLPSDGPPSETSSPTT